MAAAVALWPCLPNDVWSLDARHAQTPSLFIRHVFWPALVQVSRHGRAVCAVIAIFEAKRAHRLPPARTATCSLAVSRQRIPAGKLSVTARADVRLLARVQLAVPLEIMEPAKPHLTGLAKVRLLLAVCE
jgi:hypothetical protein